MKCPGQEEHQKIMLTIYQDGMSSDDDKNQKKLLLGLYHMLPYLVSQLPHPQFHHNGCFDGLKSLVLPCKETAYINLQSHTPSTTTKCDNTSTKRLTCIFWICAYYVFAVTCIFCLVIYRSSKSDVGMQIQVATHTCTCTYTRHTHAYTHTHTHTHTQNEMKLCLHTLLFYVQNY